jgi:hypothetical protein
MLGYKAADLVSVAEAANVRVVNVRVVAVDVVVEAVVVVVEVHFPHM